MECTTKENKFKVSENKHCIIEVVADASLTVFEQINMKTNKCIYCFLIIFVLIFLYNQQKKKKI